MEAVVESPKGGGVVTLTVDEMYEFSAPRFFDFIVGESDEELRRAELWFDSALSHDPSPWMPRIKLCRDVVVEEMCDFSEANRPPTETESEPAESKKEVAQIKSVSDVKEAEPEQIVTAEKCCSVIKNYSSLRTESQSSSTEQIKTKKTGGIKRHMMEKHSIAIANVAQENQATKRQKLDEGKSRQILSVKPVNLPHKSGLGVINNNCSLQSGNAMLRKDGRKEPAAPFVSMAEMIQKFQSKTRELALTHEATVGAASARVHKLILTCPKEPQLETSLRARPPRVKSTAELEEEMMAKIPKFKARPVNRKILEGPTLPPLLRRKAQTMTMAKSKHYAETSSLTSAEGSRQNSQRKPHLTKPKSPQLQPSLRARPPNVKSSFELELEELQKIPMFKAKPMNKKIFESKGEIGKFCTAKKQLTITEEFTLATDGRMKPANDFADMFGKLRICSESRQATHTPQITRHNPFYLNTQERGAEKAKKFVAEVLHKQECERDGISKASPYFYTIDFPMVAKQYTTPEPLEPERMVRHADDMLRQMEDRQRLEKDEAKMRRFKAHPILKDCDSIHEKVRMPLSKMEEFDLQTDQDRAELEKKVDVKKRMCKRRRKENDDAKMEEEMKALKQMRRTKVSNAQPAPKFDTPYYLQRSLKDQIKPKSLKLPSVQRSRTARQNIGTGSCSVSSTASNMR